MTFHSALGRRSVNRVTVSPSANESWYRPIVPFNPLMLELPTTEV